MDWVALMELLGMGTLPQLQRAHTQWVAEALRAGRGVREEMWSESLREPGVGYTAHLGLEMDVLSRLRLREIAEHPVAQ